MFDLKKLFARELRPRKPGKLEADSDYRPSVPRGEGLEVEYQDLIAAQFRRWGLDPGCVTIEVRLVGRAPDGFDVFVGMVRLAQWERASALRVLVGLPLLEAKVRKTVRATWLADFSHFGGLWLHASDQLSNGPAAAELRDLLLQLVPPSPAHDQAGAAQRSGAYPSSSLPQTQGGAGGSSEHGSAPVSG